MAIALLNPAIENGLRFGCWAEKEREGRRVVGLRGDKREIKLVVEATQKPLDRWGGWMDWLAGL